jgi:hypothetical protein
LPWRHNRLSGHGCRAVVRDTIVIADKWTNLGLDGGRPFESVRFEASLTLKAGSLSSAFELSAYVVSLEDSRIWRANLPIPPHVNEVISNAQ